MADFDKHIDDLIAKEGGWKLTDIKHDRGGQTYAGISRRANPKWAGWTKIDAGDLKSLEGLAKEYYFSHYWTPLKLNAVEDEDVAAMIFGAGVHQGAGTAARLAQISSGASVDGAIGPNTLQAINGTDPAMFMARFALAAINRYREICNRDRSQNKFLLGWLNRVYGELE